MTSRPRCRKRYRGQTTWGRASVSFQDGNGLGRPAGSLTRHKISRPMSHVGRPKSWFGSIERALSGPLGYQGRPYSTVFLIPLPHYNFYRSVETIRRLVCSHASSRRIALHGAWSGLLEERGHVAPTTRTPEILLRCVTGITFCIPSF